MFLNNVHSERGCYGMTFQHFKIEQTGAGKCQDIYAICIVFLPEMTCVKPDRAASRFT
jgi:hypothetical protein